METHLPQQHERLLPVGEEEGTYPQGAPRFRFTNATQALRMFLVQHSGFLGEPQLSVNMPRAEPHQGLPAVGLERLVVGIVGL